LLMLNYHYSLCMLQYLSYTISTDIYHYTQGVAYPGVPYMLVPLKLIFRIQVLVTLVILFSLVVRRLAVVTVAD